MRRASRRRLGAGWPLVAGALACAVTALTARAEAPAAVTPPGIAATVVEPRAFGYQIGDVLEQRVLLEAQGRALEPLALPPHERLGPYFARRSARVEAAADGRRWLVVEYQLINVSVGLLAADLPGWTLPLRSEPPRALRIETWPVSLAPLSARDKLNDAHLGAMQPDRPPPLPGRGSHERALRWAMAGLDLSLFSWLAWYLWRNWRAARRLPFARAGRALRGLDERSPPAWRIVHAALDEAAGRATHADSLVQFFATLPHLRPARPRIESFYVQSRALFFGDGLPAAALSVRALCAELRRLERRHER